MAPPEFFVEAGPEVTGPALPEAKAASDKAERLLRDLGVRVGEGGPRH